MFRSLVRNNQDNRNLTPWSSFRDEMWDLFDRFSTDFNSPSLSSVNEFMPRIEVRDKGDLYRIRAEIPGMDEKDINLSLNENQLVIEGEKKNEYKSEDQEGYFHSELSYGRFYRTIPLGDEIDRESINASYKDGVLSIDLKKSPEKSSKMKKIQINSGKSKELKETKH